MKFGCQKVELDYFSFFQLYFDEYVASGASSELMGGVSRPKEILFSEAATSNSSGAQNVESIEMSELRKQIQTLKAQCLTAIVQAKKLSEREKATLLQAKESVESAQAALRKSTQAANREEYMLELMTTASQDMIGNSRESPRVGFLSRHADD